MTTLPKWASKALITTALLGGLMQSPAVLAETVGVSTSQVTVSNAQKMQANLLANELDQYGRPVYAKFIGNDAEQLGRRASKTPPDPINIKKWTNQKLSAKEGYLWNRGHLVGDQFAGHASNVRENIVGETVYLNQILMTYFEGGTRKANDNAFDNWLALHPNYYLEYEVFVGWADPSHNYPTNVTLRYRGVHADGTPVRINIPELVAEGAHPQVQEDNFYTSVTLDNIQPGWVIDYVTGRATKGSASTSYSPVGNQDLEQNVKTATIKTGNKDGDAFLNWLKAVFFSWLDSIGS